MSEDSQKPAVDDELFTRWGRLRRVGELLYGSRWAGEMARELGVDRTLPAKIARGERPMTAAMEQRFADFVERKIVELRSHARTLEFIGLQIASDRFRDCDEARSAREHLRSERYTRPVDN